MLKRRRQTQFYDLFEATASVRRTVFVICKLHNVIGTHLYKPKLENIHIR